MSARRILLAVAACLLVTAGTFAQQDKVFDQARSLRRSGQPGAAAALLAAAIERHGRDERLAGLRGLCLLDDRRVPEARVLAAPFAGYAGREPRVHVLLGRLAQADANAESAIASFRAALALEPAFVEAYACLIQVAMSTRQFELAAEEAGRLEAIQPELGRSLGADALVAQAQVIRSAADEQFGYAIEKYEAALVKRPGDRAIARALLDCMIDYFRIESARALSASIFSEDRDAAERHYYEGRCLDALADPPGALAEYRAALASDAGHVAARHQIARLAIEDGRFEEAREQLALAAAAGPVSARSCLLLGLAEEGLGHDVQSEAALRESVSLDPGNNKALYHLGRLLVRTGRGSEGEALLARVNTGPR